VLVLIHVLSGLEMQQPIILADELGYLGNARYLSGTAHLPAMGERAFYHFGYSLFLLPAFWLFSDPVSIYKATVVINALLVSSLYFPLYFILTSHTHATRKTARWIAFACCLYPPLVLYSSFAWSENAFVPLYVLAAALFGRYLASKSSRDAVLVSLAAAFLYTVHPRALPVVAAVIAYLLVLTLLKAISIRQFLLSASTIAAVSLMTRLVNQHLKATGWTGGIEFSATKLAGRLLPGPDFPALIERASGQVLYLSLASHGLFLLGLIGMMWLILRNLQSGSLRQVLANPAAGVPLFVLISASGIVLASSTLKLYSLHGTGVIKGANFIHGRYNEAFAVLSIAFALAEYCRRDLRKRQLVGLVIAVTATILLLTVVVMAEVEDALKRHVADKPGVEPSELILPSEVDAIAVPGVYPLVKMVGGLKLYPISFAAMGSFLLITLMMRVSKRGGVALLMLLFCLLSYYNYRHYLKPRTVKRQPRLTFASQVRRLGPIAAISYDTAHRKPGFLAAMQYLLQDTAFDRFDSASGEEPASEAVISGKEWRQAHPLGARLAVSSGRTALWFLPGEMQSRLPPAADERVDLGVERLSVSPGSSPGNGREH
jgi:hypothetical protein